MKRVYTKACLLLLSAFAGAQAYAYPYQGLRPQEGSLAGPTDGSLAALHLNPAALQLLSGVNLQLSLGGQATLGSYTPADAKDPKSNLALGIYRAAFGASWDLGSESVTLAVALHTPYVERTRFGGEDESLTNNPARYHVVSAENDTVFGTVASSVRVASFLTLGASFNFGWSRYQYHFLRDLDPDDGLTRSSNPEVAKNALDLRLDTAGIGYGFTVGLLYIPVEDRVWLGASYTSPLFCDDQGRVGFTGAPPSQDVSGTCLPPGQTPDRQAGLRASYAGGAQGTGAAKLSYAFPHLIYLGGRGRLPGTSPLARSLSYFEIASYLRISIPQRRDAEIQLEGLSLASADGLSRLMVPRRQLWPLLQLAAVALDVDLRQRWRRLELLQGFIYESPRTPLLAVSPANLESHKLDLTLGMRLHFGQLILGVSAGATLFVFGQEAGGWFSKVHADACRGAKFPIDQDSCRAVEEGWAVPSAKGAYDRLDLHGGVTLEFRR